MSDRDVAGTAVIGGRLVVWLVRHPMATVMVLLAAIGVFTVAGAQLLVRANVPTAASTGDAEVAPGRLPAPTQSPPKRRVDKAHRAFHALSRACENPMLQRKPEQVRAPLDVLKGFATNYPSGGFSMDDASSSTLALMVVVWNELENCDPAYLPEIERLVPAQYRGG